MESSPIYNLDDMCLAFIVSKLDYVSAQMAKCAWPRFNQDGPRKRVDVLKVVIGLVAAGELHALKVIHARGGLPTNKVVLIAAARNGRLEVMKWLHSVGHELTEGIMIVAAGFVDCVKWLLDNNCPIGDYALDGAGRAGCLETFRLLHERQPDIDLAGECFGAIEYGQLHILQYVIDQGYKFDKNIIDLAAQIGRVSVMKYLRKHGVHVRKKTIMHAAGHLDAMKWAYKHRPVKQLDPRVMHMAQQSGNIQCVMWLLDLFQQWHTDEGYTAAAAGLDMLKYVHANGGPIGPNAWRGAISYNNVDCLHYLRRAQIPFEENGAAFLAIKMSAVESLRMLVQRMGVKILPQMIERQRWGCSTECFIYAWGVIGAEASAPSINGYIRVIATKGDGVKILKFLLGTKQSFDLDKALADTDAAHRHCGSSPYSVEGRCKHFTMKGICNHIKFRKLLLASAAAK